MTDHQKNLRENALDYHRNPVPGKLCITPTKPLSNKNDLALAYSPGVAYACEEIVADPNAAAEMTARGNLVGVVTNGTAVLGLGAIGALASKPVMEGKAVLFKKFADIDVFDIEIDENDVDRLVEVVAALEPTFGGINLEDIKAPDCFIVEQKLRERMKIPVFHDDQHGTAIVAAAAVYNGLRVVDKKFEEVRLVASGSGAASIACVDLLVSMGLKRENVLLVDRSGVVYEGRTEGMNPWKQRYANKTDCRTLDDAIDGADIFMGLSGPGVLKPEMCKKMARDPLILAMANPVPEIMPELAKEVRPDAIIATGRSDYPNQVNNVLCFPFIFRGALDCGATTINEEMKQACVKAIADLAHKETTDVVAAAYAGEELRFGADYLIPKPFDPRLIEEIPPAVVQAAMDSGVASRPIEDMDAYRDKLKAYNFRSRLFMQPVIEVAKQSPARIVYSEGENIDVLRATQLVVDEGIARPILLGREEVILRQVEQSGLRLKLGEDFAVIDPRDADQHQDYWEHYHAVAGRNGVSVEAAQTIVRSKAAVFGAVMVERGDADGLICGKVGRYSQHLADIRSVMSPEDDSNDRLASVCALLLPEGPLFIADPFVHVDPPEALVVAMAEDTIGFVRNFGIEPKVALLSHSNFGTYEDPSALKMKRAASTLRNRHPELQIEGEMNSISALNEYYRSGVLRSANLNGRANVLIMPNMDTASIALGLIRSITNARLVGPYLLGLRQPAHILIPTVSARGIFNMTAITVADARRQTATPD